jgi:hypothetical protein
VEEKEFMACLPKVKRAYVRADSAIHRLAEILSTDSLPKDWEYRLLTEYSVFGGGWSNLAIQFDIYLKADQTKIFGFPFELAEGRSDLNG